MANPGLTDEQMQEAVDLLEQYGSIKAVCRAKGFPYSTFENRVTRAQFAGKRPQVLRDPVVPVVRERLGRVHMVIPDIQAKPNVDHYHLEWIANYAIEKRPDVIVQIGDWADMPSLSLYDKGKRCYEGRRYVKDIEAANFSLERFERTLEEYNRSHTDDPYSPRKVQTRGNHENRIERATMLDASLDGKLTLEDLDFERRGWECHDFLKPVDIDGIEYAHYFISGSMGRPVSSASALLKARSSSATMGHVQRMDVAYHPQTQQIGLFCGTCYLHDEDYLGPQGNNAPRQIIMKHEVEDGRYDLMAVSLRFLQKRYS
jgi:hypothetical protein